jgi:hypothetical protein
MTRMKFRIHQALITTALAALLVAGAQARTWTSADGSKTFEGELKSYDEASGMVVVTARGGSPMSFKQDILSADDIAWLKAEGSKPAAGKASGGASTGMVRELPKVLPVADGKAADMSKPVQVYILLGQSNMVGLGKIASLEDAVKSQKKYLYLADEAGNWIERKDVRNVFMMTFKIQCNGWLSVNNRKNLGPELGIGHCLGYAVDAPVMILKSCIGNRSLGWDLLPPGSEPWEFEGKTIPGYRGTPGNPKGNGEKVSGEWYAGKQYDDDVEGAKQVLANLDTYYPGAKKYEIAGFFLWQGEKDCGSAADSERYEKNLVRFIKRLRIDFDAPNAKFVLATLGEAKKGEGGNKGKVTDAQLAVDGKGGKYPEFKGNVATVYANPLCHGGSGNSHYNGNAETYMDVGEAMGRAMVGLLAK